MVPQPAEVGAEFLQIIRILDRLFISVERNSGIAAKGINMDHGYFLMVAVNRVRQGNIEITSLLFHKLTPNNIVSLKKRLHYGMIYKTRGITMFDITLITMGKLKEKFYISAAEEYKKRLGGYCKFTLLELPEVRLPEDPSPAEISAGLDKEADLIFSKIPKGAWFCVFTPEGKELSSEKFADKLKEVKLSGKSSACFLIGSSFGMSPRVKEKADFRLSMGPMTFPHHLARIMVLEQLYRAEAIQAGSKYHK